MPSGSHSTAMIAASVSADNSHSPPTQVWSRSTAGCKMFSVCPDGQPSHNFPAEDFFFGWYVVFFASGVTSVIPLSLVQIHYAFFPHSCSWEEHFTRSSFKEQPKVSSEVPFVRAQVSSATFRAGFPSLLAEHYFLSKSWVLRTRDE